MLCHNLVGKSLHGEAAEMTNEERAAKMNMFLDELHHKIEQENITLDRLYNASQTGLFSKSCQIKFIVIKRSEEHLMVQNK